MKIIITESQYKLYLEEKNVTKVPESLGGIMSTIAPIPKSKIQASKVIPKILNSEGIGTYDFSNSGSDVDLNSDIKKTVDRIRFYQYFISLQEEMDGRGFFFEGLMAGLFTGGIAIPTSESNVEDSKADILIQGVPYSVKLSIPGERYSLGSLNKGFKIALKNIADDDSLSTEGIKKPYDLMKKGPEFNFYKNQMMEVSFNNVNWIFAVLPKTGNVIEYSVKNNEEVMDLLLREPKAGKTSSSISLSHNDALSGNKKSIIFPIVDVNTIKNFKYDKERGQKIDKIGELFGKYAKNVRYDILEYIRKNPDAFLKRVINLYGDRLKNLM
jgi:hypothetical protein